MKVNEEIYLSNEGICSHIFPYTFIVGHWLEARCDIIDILHIHSNQCRSITSIFFNGSYLHHGTPSVQTILMLTYTEQIVLCFLKVQRAGEGNDAITGHTERQWSCSVQKVFKL